jgi:L-threonylcarbamoyladenylate synthase
MQIIKKVVEIIKNGGVVIAPTDTVYGLICDSTNKKAVEKIFKIKKRPKKKLIPIFVSDIKMAKKFADISPKQEKFLKQVWPGKVTAVFPYKKPGLRIPDYKLVLSLVKRVGPLAESSANISGQPASGNIKEVLKQFKGKKYQPDFIINAGNLPKSKPSKVIDLTIWPPKTLRP